MLLHNLFRGGRSFLLVHKRIPLFLVPFLIGFMRTIRSEEPTEALLFTGRRIFGLATLVLVLGVVSYWWPVVAILAMGVAMLGRFTIAMRERIADETRPAYFAARDDGLVVLGIIPNQSV